tara:strand:+ start:141 stop:362 length:222 start_codon:yes stop_codon:yes gene_type:complete
METLVVTLTLTTVVSFLALLVGGMIGWMARTHSLERSYAYNVHPEMFDENGNLIADEVVSLRFENKPEDVEDE